MSSIIVKIGGVHRIIETEPLGASRFSSYSKGPQRPAILEIIRNMWIMSAGRPGLRTVIRCNFNVPCNEDIMFWIAAVLWASMSILTMFCWQPVI